MCVYVISHHESVGFKCSVAGTPASSVLQPRPLHMYSEPHSHGCSLIGKVLMDLNELLSYKPSKRAGEKRPLEHGEKAPASKAPRTKLGGAENLSVNPPLATGSLDISGNGISHEEKLRLLQSVDDDDEDVGE